MEENRETNISIRTDIGILKREAENGNAEAMYYLGVLMYRGNDKLEPDIEASRRLLKESAELGMSDAAKIYDTLFPKREGTNTGVKEEVDGPLKSLFGLYDSLVFVDTETSGLDSKYDHIIELAALKITGVGNGINEESILDDFIRLPDGERLDPKITELTNITEEQLNSEGKDINEVLGKFVDMVSDQKTLFIAYNAQFDIGFIYQSLKRENLLEHIKFFDKLDALTIYKDRRPYPHKLKDAIEMYDLGDKVSNTHRAIDDVRALEAVLIAMDEEEDDLVNYINLFGYNPKYGINGSRFTTVRYVEQPYNSYKKIYE